MPAPADELHGLLFDVRRSVRYHMRRRAFYERWNKFTSAINIISGSSTIVGLLQNYPVLPIVTASIITLVSTIDLVIASPQTAREHGDLSKAFIELEKNLSLQVILRLMSGMLLPWSLSDSVLKRKSRLSSACLMR